MPQSQNRSLPAPFQLPRIVVIGNGMVSHLLIEQLQRQAGETSIQSTVACGEPRLAYNRVHLFSHFDIPTLDLTLATAEGYEQSGVRLVYGRAGAGNTAQKAVQVHSVDNRDPFTGTDVILRGLTGSDMHGSELRLKVVSPLLKHGFDQETGQSLDSPNMTPFTYPARAEGGEVWIGLVD